MRGFKIHKYEHFWSFIGACLGVGLIALLQTQFDSVFLIASFGASSVLIYGATQSPIAQPRNLIFGHMISAAVGVTIYKMLPDIIWLTAPLAVSLSIILMQITKTLHPPGGATALNALIGTEKIKSLGYVYVFSPVLTGAIILLIIAFIFNNISPKSYYPANGGLSALFKRKILRQKSEFNDKK